MLLVHDVSSNNDVRSSSSSAAGPLPVVPCSRAFATSRSQRRPSTFAVVSRSKPLRPRGDQRYVERVAQLAIHALNLSCRCGLIRSTQTRQEAVTAGEIDKRRVELMASGPVRIALDHHRLHDVVEHAARHAAEERERAPEPEEAWRSAHQSPIRRSSPGCGAEIRPSRPERRRTETFYL